MVRMEATKIKDTKASWVAKGGVKDVLRQRDWRIKRQRGNGDSEFSV